MGSRCSFKWGVIGPKVSDGVSEIKFFILNHNFSILLDTCIGYGYGTHFEVSVIHRGGVQLCRLIRPCSLCQAGQPLRPPPHRPQHPHRMELWIQRCVAVLLPCHAAKVFDELHALGKSVMRGKNEKLRLALCMFPMLWCNTEHIRVVGTGLLYVFYVQMVCRQIRIDWLCKN